ncbi:MAG: IS91 family transposase [Bacteroidales bacterium]|nr:IS91 family transposase [Bacteroidales bacterium]
MSRPKHEVAEVIERFGERFIEIHQPNGYQLRVLGALSKCRTSALGGHKYRCDHCGSDQISYNSCRNRHCPKCQGSNQTFWVEDRINNAYPVSHYHIVFTVPEALHGICMLDSKWFYNHLFTAVWDTLRSFGYSHYGAESGAICVLHTWGQNLSLHPHIHCIVPSLGYTLRGKMKHIGKQRKYLYPITQLSKKFQGKFMAEIKGQLLKSEILSQYRSSIKKAWSTPWVVHCEPSLGKVEHVVGYLGQYIHRVAISNHRIVEVNNQQVRFILKDNRDQGKVKTTTLTGEEFLRRFCLHILPSGFVKIRYYGIYSTRFRTTILNVKQKMTIKPKETSIERIFRLMGIDVRQCPCCKVGHLVPVATVPRIRPPPVQVHLVTY